MKYQITTITFNVDLFYVAPSEPTKLRIVQLGSTFIDVTWNIPTHPNGPITNYIVGETSYKLGI